MSLYLRGQWFKSIQAHFWVTEVRNAKMQKQQQAGATTDTVTHKRKHKNILSIYLSEVTTLVMNEYKKTAEQEVKVDLTRERKI